MYVCICNPFTDKDVNAYLVTKTGKTNTKDVYTACSDGESMNCGTCACELKKMVDTHNNTQTIKALSDTLDKITLQTKEIA